VSLHLIEGTGDIVHDAKVLRVEREDDDDDDDDRGRGKDR
jgi:hypothetical protein